MTHSSEPFRWQGRIDAEEGPKALRWHQRINALPQQLDKPQHGIALLGFASDCGVARNHGRIGARDGPDAIRRMLANLPILESDLKQALFDAGNIICHNDQLEEAQNQFAKRIRTILQMELTPIGLGGGHEIAYASFAGLADYLQTTSPKKPRIGILNIDAHFDLRASVMSNKPEPTLIGTSGTPFRQIAEFCTHHQWSFNYCCLGVSEYANTQALFDRARALNVAYCLDEQLQSVDAPALHEHLPHWLAQQDVIYLTLCLDALPAAVAPGVSAPNPYGIPLPVFEKVIDTVCASGKLRIADVAEYNPQFDIDHRTARVAARLVGRISRHLAQHLHSHAKHPS